MNAIRITSIVAILLLVVYHVLRIAAAACSGAQCDAYIPLSLVVPIAVLVVAAVAGSLAIDHARLHGRSWLGVLVTATILDVIGPPVAVAIFRDQPDTVVLTATVLLLPAPAAALAYSVRSLPSRFP